MVDGLDYVFDQAKFEEYLSSSSSKSPSPRKHRWIPTSKREVRSVIVRGESYNNTPANCQAGSSADSIPLKESSLKVSATLSKRARQRQRQKLAHKLAKALESTDGVHYRPGSRQQHKTPQPHSVSTPANEEWVLVKRTRITKKERAQRRRARAARARAILRKAQESKAAKGSNRKVWIPKSAEEQPQNNICTRDSADCLALSETVQTVALAARRPDQSRPPRDGNKRRANFQDSADCLALSETVQTVALSARRPDQSRSPRDGRKRRANFRDTSTCLARNPCTRDTTTCLGQIEATPGTFNCSNQTSSAPIRPATSSVFNRLGPLPNDKGKAPVLERLGHARQHVGGRAQNQVTVQRYLEQTEASQSSRLPITSRLSIPQGVRESAKEKELKRISRKVTRVDEELVIHADTTPRVSNDRRPQKKTCLSIKDNVILGGATRDNSCQSQNQAGGGNMRKRTIGQINCSCSCAQLIKMFLSGCACSESNAHSQRASIFERLSLPTTEELKPKPRRFRKRRPVQRDEFPEVTINVANKGKGAATNADPEFTPGGRVSSQISQRMSRLQLRAMKHIDYRRMHEGESSEDEISDSCSAMASDDTMSSVGQAREAFTITPETLAQMLQEALAKQREELKAEMKIEMELAMQQMRELQSQKAAQPESSQQGGTSRRVAQDIEDSDTEVDEHIHADQPPNKTAEDLNHPTGGGLKQEEDDNDKMKELEGKINALMSAREVKKTGIPCPYPREWDSIPYPSKFNLINFTPFDGRGSPTQHLIYFKSHLGVISGNEPLMVRSFVGTLRGAAFDWYRRLKAGSINCWDDMESSFLNNFFDDETDVSIRTLLDEKQKSGETIDCFVKRFRNKAINCKDPITEEFILQTCHNNLSIDLLEVMGVVPPTTWKDLKIRGEQAERFLKRKKNERGEPITGLSNSNLISRSKKNASAAAVDQKLQQQHPRQRKTSDRRLQEEYSFKDEEVPAIFKHLLENNKIKLPPITNQEEADKTSDPKYCAYHRRILHPTKDCLALKAIIQALVEAGVLTPK